MRVVRLPGIHHDCNATLILGETSAVLVDVGTSWYQLLIEERIRGQLNSLELECILLTCRRFNHCGGASYISEKFGNIPTHIHSTAQQALDTGDFFTTWASRFDSDMPRISAKGLNDGQKFDLDDEQIETIELPGHSVDSVGYFVESSNLLISGPTIAKADAPARWDQPTGCLPDLVESVSKIMKLELESLIPAYGDTIKGKHEINQVLNRHLSFFQKMVEDGGVQPKNWPRPAATSNHLTPKPAWEQLEQ